ncbi:hypothetical protein RBS60_10985 [Sinomonas sp. ASV486]|uniref:hypothetical protein n=1 Tax=Sinomonas sp. ASV486 TaxID=3051170 RepID=UPI0027DC5090|nr:hypothetical protein [Sinomonas sp. ASV486]MDQ4490722.1 hypothetical protein [Sinomonas sp. ASV486]
MAENERFFLRPDKDIDEMSEDELDEFAMGLADRVSTLARRKATGAPQSDSTPLLRQSHHPCPEKPGEA